VKDILIAKIRLVEMPKGYVEGTRAIMDELIKALTAKGQALHITGDGRAEIWTVAEDTGEAK
jgi:hypothetical protein